MNNIETLFLLGCMRSGTTLFRNILASHQNVLTLGSELNAFWSAAGVPAGIVARNPPMGKGDARTDLVNFVKAEFAKRSMRRNNAFNLAYRLYRKCRYGNETLLKSGVPFYLLNKSTQHLNKIPLLREIFPQALFICIIRDVYSHAYSMKKHLEKIEENKSVFIHYPEEPGCSWSFLPKSEPSRLQGLKSYSYADIAHYWIEQNFLAVSAFQEMDPDNFLVLNFTDLVRQPNSVLPRTRAWLNLKSAGTRPSWRMINNLTTSPLDQWREDMSQSDKAIIRKVLNCHRSRVDIINDFLRAHS